MRITKDNLKCFDDEVKKLCNRTIFTNDPLYKNHYIPFKPYNLQKLVVLYANDNSDTFNQVLGGAGGFGGKTSVGSMLAAQYLPYDDDYTCLVTRRNYAELLDTNSIWENLISWCCDEETLGKDYVCDYKLSPSPKIIAPNGNTIYFKAFDHEKKKQKLKSASYDRIVNDEASELPVQVLKFQYRSLRNTSAIPLSIINLSNPGGESTDYLISKFVDGSSPYIAMDWRDNPFINKHKYSVSLDELDYVDQQYQKYGNWHYKPTSGDLITFKELEKSLTPPSYVDNYKVMFNGIGIDLAGRGRDRTCPASMVLLENGKKMLVGLTGDESAYPEETVYNFIEKQIQDYYTNVIKFEREPGGDSLYSLRYWQDELYDLTFPDGVIVDDIGTGSKSKFNRARPVARAIKNGELLISDDIDDDCLQRLFDQFIYISPSPEEMANLKSPDELDAVVYAYLIIKELESSYVVPK
ncbi:hypothetical protein [Methanobrevibacter olleyae]|uniref:Phage terminase large subunit n=1 Tax=Methanobrevibacter olleyae TaxID=294671 RepID=A0A126R2P1_METOL|nr:hypothetical protein [Methanobrevibacter olleyae]AMK16314.1 phage terminase large subunit [Methanobrevibacter olleyae]